MKHISFAQSYMKKIFRAFVSFIFPVRSNIKSLMRLTPDELLLNVRSAPILPDNIIAAFSYRDKGIRSLIWSLKYHHNKDAAALLGKTLALHVQEELSEKREFGTYISPCIIPIPLHHKKEKERGYNQSLLIAQAFAKQLGFPDNTIQTGVLVRTKYTQALARSASRHARYESIQNAFACSDSSRIKNKDIILIDDVITSGATMNEAKSVLLQAGAREVLALAIAH